MSEGPDPSGPSDPSALPVATTPPPPSPTTPLAPGAGEDAATTIAVAAHELKNAMGGIAMALARCDQRLLSGKPVGPEHIAAARAELRRLSALVNTWLDRARPALPRAGVLPPAPDAPGSPALLASGASEAPAATVDLRALAGELAEVFEATHGRAVRLALPAEPKGLCAAAPTEQVRAVLLNYLENARKYAPAPATIALRIAAPSARRADRLRVEVTDDGPGIHPDHQPRLFERFFRAPEADPRIAGTGLGLSICRSIAESLGGEVGVESAPGRGATFWLDLPLP
jgi:signal transduction histidine kinase